jgi:hypothetical protein
MTHLTQTHTVFSVVREEIANIIAMRRVTGYATQLSAGTFFGRIIFATQWMSPTSRNPNYMLLVSNMTMT